MRDPVNFFRRLGYGLMISAGLGYGVFLGGCSGLMQKAITVEVAPISQEYRLNERLKGKTYVLLAKTSTGDEEHAKIVSDCLVEVLKKERGGGLEVLSFWDFANILNENELVDKFKIMEKFYEENGMYRETDMHVLREKIGADYFISPSLVYFEQYDKKRWDIPLAGIRLLTTQISNTKVRIEILDLDKGKFVFAGSAEINLAKETIREKAIPLKKSVEEALEGIVEKLPE